MVGEVFAFRDAHDDMIAPARAHVKLSPRRRPGQGGEPLPQQTGFRPGALNLTWRSIEDTGQDQLAIREVALTGS
jgi:hypothetical protein